MSKKRRQIPNYQRPIIETHCHLDYLKEAPLAEVIQQAQNIGVERIVTISVTPGNLATVRDLAAGSELIWATQGIHPHDAKDYTSEVEAEIRSHLNDPRILAVGEIGLDYYYQHSDRAVQRKAFERQLQLAVDARNPVVIHTRDADADTRAILADFVAKMPQKGVIHSFTSGLELAEYCLSEGFCLGFNGICTFNKADNVREVIAITPLEQILLETDAPYLTPVPYRGKENAPCYLPFIAEKIAAIKEVTVETVLEQTYQNSLRVLFQEASYSPGND